MKAHGNGTVQQCTHNLLQIVRGEVPFDRIKGLDPRIIDSPASDDAQAAKNDALWLISTYEPRAVDIEVDVTADEAQDGAFVLTANVTHAQEGSGNT